MLTIERSIGASLREMRFRGAPLWGMGTYYLPNLMFVSKARRQLRVALEVINLGVRYIFTA